jgi:hypothetical protein
MVQLVRSPQLLEAGGGHYCEIGMNGGHSVSAMLLANPTATAHVFDLMRLKYSWRVADLLGVTFGGRFELHPGKSQSTLGPWIRDFRRNGS